MTKRWHGKVYGGWQRTSVLLLYGLSTFSSKNKEVGKVRSSWVPVPVPCVSVYGLLHSTVSRLTNYEVPRRVSREHGRDDYHALPLVLDYETVSRILAASLSVVQSHSGKRTDPDRTRDAAPQSPLAGRVGVDTRKSTACALFDRVVRALRDDLHVGARCKRCLERCPRINPTGLVR